MLSDNPVEVLNEHLFLLVGSYVKTMVVRVHNKDKPWIDDYCRHAFGLKQEAHLRWTCDRSRVNWEEFVCRQVKANETYSEAKRQLSDRNRVVLMNVQSPHKWWSTLKSGVFGTSSSLPPLVNEGGLMCESDGKADLLSDNFDSKQSREAFDLLLTCHPSASLITTFAFRSRGVTRLMLDLDLYGGTDPLGMFPLFLKITADVMAPRLCVVFRRLVRLGSFPPSGDMPMSPQFRKVHSPPLLPNTVQFP